MDRRRFLLGSAVGASLLAGPQVELSQAHGTNGESKANDDGDGGDEEVEEGAGLRTVESDEGFDATVERIRSAIEGNDALTLVATVDHAANARSVGMELPPTTLLLFGDPRLGTPLMQSSRSTAIDLPQKLLVWEEDGAVMVSYNDPQYLDTRHGIENEEGTLETIAGALESLATGKSG